MITLYQTIRVNGKYFLRGYKIESKYRRQVSLEETTRTETLFRLAYLRSVINDMHPRK